MNNKWIEFELTNIDTFIIHIEFSLINVDTIHIHDMNTTHRHELSPLVFVLEFILTGLKASFLFFFKRTLFYNLL